MPEPRTVRVEIVRGEPSAAAERPAIVRGLPVPPRGLSGSTSQWREAGDDRPAPEHPGTGEARPRSAHSLMAISASRMLLSLNRTALGSKRSGSKSGGIIDARSSSSSTWPPAAFHVSSASW